MCIVVCDGLKGLPDAITTTWPLAAMQTCVIHLLRNTFRYAGRHDWDAMASDPRPVYTAVNAAHAERQFEVFADRWAAKYPAAVRLRRSAMPGVLEAAVIAVPDVQWVERPLAFVVVNGGQSISGEEVRDLLLSSGFTSWQLPDHVELIDEIPKTAIGKFTKKALRAGTFRESLTSGICPSGQ